MFDCGEYRGDRVVPSGSEVGGMIGMSVGQVALLPVSREVSDVGRSSEGLSGLQRML
jgi:hypothetical protein